MPYSDYLARVRARLGRDMLISPGAAAVVLDDQGRVLLQLRGDIHRWGLPGGAIEPLECPADGVVREVWEETGLIIEPMRLSTVGGGPEYHAVYPNGDEISIVSVTFEGRVIGGTLRPDGDETLELAYFPPDALPLEIVPRARKRIENTLACREAAHFEPPTWTPPQNGHIDGGMSAYMRNLRAKVGSGLIIVAGVVAAIYDEQGRILLERRRDNDRWGLIGGSIDPLELPSSAIVREVWEETGLLVEPVKAMGVYGGAELLTVYPGGDEISPIVFLFECRISGGEVRSEMGETRELAYFAPDELAGLSIWGMHRPIVRALHRRDLTYFEPPTWQPPDNL